MNAYEERREANIARNKRRLAELGLCDAVSKFEALFKKTRTPRASKVKGTAAVRKSARTAKPVQENLSEEHLAGGPESEGVALRISRKRFDTETMPKRKAVLHEFDDKHLFTDDNTLAFAQAWFGPLFKQPQLRSREDICEAMAYNLAEEYYTIDSLRNADAAKLDRVRKAAFSDIDAKGGWEDALNTVLSNLQQGASAASNDPSDGRHGDGQTLANNLFRQYVADSVARYKNFNEDGSSAGPGDAEKGISHFLADPDRSKEFANTLQEVWARVKGCEDAVKLYGKDHSGGGKEYNSTFRKCLTRKFLEADLVRKDKRAARMAEASPSGMENASPNLDGDK